MAINLVKAGLEGTAYGVLNEILSEFRSGDGYARPSRYEVLIQPPNGVNGTVGLNYKIYGFKIMGKMKVMVL